MFDLQALLLTDCVDIIALTETWHDDNFLDSEFIVMITISLGRTGLIVAVVESFRLSKIRFPAYKGQTWKRNLRG